MKNLYLLIFILTSTIASTHSWEAKARLSLYKEDGKTHLATNINNNAFPDRLIVYLSFAGGNISLKLLRNIHLISKEYSAESETNGTKINEADLLCYYHGRVINSDGNDDVANVALSLCDGLRGSFVMNESWFDIRSENNQANKWNYVHLKKEENNKNYSCGFESNRKVPKLPNRKRKRSALIMDRRIKIVEIVAVVDTTVLVALQNDNAAANRRCLDIINLANLGLDMFLVVVAIKFHNEKVPDAATSRDYLENWMKFRISKLHEYPTHDLGLLLTKKTFESVVGTALENVICKLSSAVAFVSDIEPMSVSSATLAHEIGHSFGALHDEDYGGCKCPQKACLLETVIKNEPDFGWSDCSISVIAGLYETATDICLYNSAEFIGNSVCGDGLVDAREQCDCGRLPSHLCNKDCCDKESCRFVSGKGCSQGSCCDIKQCKVMRRNTICRSKREECDEDDKCDGTSAECPKDGFKANGAMCNGQNYCFEGTCVSKDKACSKLYGRKVKASPDSCYTRNTEGSGVFNCGYDMSNFSKVVPCTAENKMCGALHCDANEDMLHAVFKRYKSIQAFGTTQYMCTVIDFDVYLSVTNLGFVPDGAKCGEAKVCLHRNCITRTAFIAQTNRRQELSSGISHIKYWKNIQSFSIIFTLLLVTN